MTTTKKPKRSLDQQVADLAARQKRDQHHKKARALLDLVKSALHERDFPAALVHGRALLEDLNVLPGLAGQLPVADAEPSGFSDDGMPY